MSAVSAVFGSATAAGRALLEADAAVRMPLPACRRIGFVHLAPGRGGSTTAAAVATVLARRRAGMVLAVDASPSPRGLLPLLGATGGRAARSTATTAAEARDGLATAPSGCYAVDLRPAGDWSAVAGITRFFDVVVTDWGLRHDLRPVLEHSDVICLVVRARDAGNALPYGLAAGPAAPATRPPAPGTGPVAPGTRPVVVAVVGGRRVRAPAVAVGAGPRQSLRLAAELMRPTGGDRRDR